MSSVIEALRAAAAFLPGMDPFNIEEIINLCQRNSPPARRLWRPLICPLRPDGQAPQPAVLSVAAARQSRDRLYPVIPLDEPQEMAPTASSSRRWDDDPEVKLGTHPTEDPAAPEAISECGGRRRQIALDINQGWKEHAQHWRPSTPERIQYRVHRATGKRYGSGRSGSGERRHGDPIMADESCHNAADVFKIAC
jgi:L-alanine-DL-glutamate epimerase-like enolase superfamily enzyme